MTEPGSQDGNAAQIAYWNDTAAVTWTTFQEQMDAVLTALTEIALDAADPKAGERVLDVGCGCGATILALAQRVGPTGHVLGLDVSKPMAARARERIARQALSQADVAVADASARDLSGTNADLLFSRFGVMFFADPVAAFTNLRQAMRPDGRLLFACWRPLSENMWFRLPLEATSTLLPPQPPSDPLAPGPFAFADADRVRGILTEAGWRDVKTERRDVPMRLAGPGDLEKAATFATRVGPLARMLAEAEPDVRSRAHDAVLQALRGHDGPDGIILDGSIWLVSARAPVSVAFYRRPDTRAK